VGQHDGREVGRFEPGARQPADDFAQRESAVDQDGRAPALNHHRVAATAAAENGEAQTTVAAPRGWFLGFGAGQGTPALTKLLLEQAHETLPVSDSSSSPFTSSTLTLVPFAVLTSRIWKRSFGPSSRLSGPIEASRSLVSHENIPLRLGAVAS
jgi:hypothetical protein